MNIKKTENYIIAISLVPHGYQIDLLEWEGYLNDKIKRVHSECRDYGKNINTHKATEKIIELVRNMEL